MRSSTPSTTAAASRSSARSRPSRIARGRPGRSRCVPLEQFGMDELLAERACRASEVDNEIVLRACRELGIASAVVPADVPARARRLPARRRRRAARRRRALHAAAAASRPRPSSRGSGAPSAAPRRAWRSRASCCAPRSARTACSTLDGEPLTCERIKVAVERAFSRARRRRRGVHRLARPADRRRPRDGPRPDRARRAGRPRPLPARPRERLLRRHDADVRRRRAAARRSSEYQRLCREALRRPSTRSGPACAGSSCTR